MTGGLLHQGIALQVPPFQYTELDELLGRAAAAKTFTPLLVALDGVTDPRNLGAVIRSAVAFGAQGVIVPERRAAGVTAAAWRTSAGNAAHIPIAQVTNLTRSLKACQQAGLFVVGLDAARRHVDLRAGQCDRSAGRRGRFRGRRACRAWSARPATCWCRIPMAGAVESLNASVAAAVTLSEIARLRASDVAAASRPGSCPSGRKNASGGVSAADLGDLAAHRPHDLVGDRAQRVDGDRLAGVAGSCRAARRRWR